MSVIPVRNKSDVGCIFNVFGNNFASAVFSDP